jgi:hypothetical protein
MNGTLRENWQNGIHQYKTQQLRLIKEIKYGSNYAIIVTKIFSLKGLEGDYTYKYISIYIYVHTHTHRQKKISTFWEVMTSVVVKKFCINICQILNSYQTQLFPCNVNGSNEREITDC